MKIPPGDSYTNANEHGFYGNYEEAPYFFEQVEVSENGVSLSPALDTNSTAAEADFSEYMWMEHMEEFDREVCFICSVLWYNALQKYVLNNRL